MTIDQLTQLDPARDIPDSLVDEARAQATLAQITGDAPGTIPLRTRPRRMRTLTGLAAGTLVVGGAVVANLASGPSAFASWSPVPVPVSAEQQTEWGAECADGWSDSPGAPFDIQLVERRGDFAYTVLSGSDSYEATCIKWLDAPEGESWGFGYHGPLEREPVPEGLTANGVRAQELDGDTWFEVTGKAGDQVAAISFDANGASVHATLEDGYFAVWWPETRPRLPRFGPPNPIVTVTLTDGTTIAQRIHEFDAPRL